MKKTCSLFLIAKAFIFLSACNQHRSDPASVIVPVITDASEFPVSSTPVTAAQAAALDSLLALGKISNAVDFKKAADSLKSTAVKKEPANRGTSGQAKQNDLLTGYASSHEDIYYACIDNWQPGDRLVHDTITKTINSHFECRLNFGIRGNQINVLVPFKYDCKTNSPAGINSISNIQQSNRVQLIPMDPYGKNLTQGHIWYINTGYYNDTWQRAAIIEAFGTGQEKRTIIKTTNGELLITPSRDANALKSRSELEDGFKVQTAAYTYNQYTISAKGLVSIRDYKKPGNFLPYTQFYGIIKAEQVGTLKN